MIIYSVKLLQCSLNTNIPVMLDKLQWPTLKDWRHHLIAAMMYKIVSNLIDVEASLYLTPTTSATRGHSRRYLHIQARINTYHHSFFDQL